MSLTLSLFKMMFLFFVDILHKLSFKKKDIALKYLSQLLR